VIEQRQANGLGVIARLQRVDTVLRGAYRRLVCTFYAWQNCVSRKKVKKRPEIEPNCQISHAHKPRFVREKDRSHSAVLHLTEDDHRKVVQNPCKLLR